MQEIQVYCSTKESSYLPISYRNNGPFEVTTSKIFTYKEGKMWTRKYTVYPLSEKASSLSATMDDIIYAIECIYNSQIHFGEKYDQYGHNGKIFPQVGSSTENKLFGGPKEIADFLGLESNEYGNVATNLRKLLLIGIKGSKWCHELDAKEVSAESVDVEGPIIKETTAKFIKKVRMPNGEIKDGTFSCIELNSYWAGLIRSKELVPIDHNLYLKLKRGPLRKIHRFCETKRVEHDKKVLQYNFTEVIGILGRADHKRPFSKTKKDLLKYAEACPYYSFELNKIDGEWIVKQSFNKLAMDGEKQKQDSEKHSGSYNDFCLLYGEKPIERSGLDRLSISAIINEINKSYISKDDSTSEEGVAYTMFKNKKNPVGELILDIALWQGLVAGYNVTSYPGLARKILEDFLLGEIQIPRGYTKSFSERIETTKAEKARRELAIQEQEEREKQAQAEEILNNFAISYFDKAYKKDKTMQRKVKQMVENFLDSLPQVVDEQTREQLFKKKEKEIVVRLYKEGEIHDIKETKGSSLLEYVQESIQAPQLLNESQESQANYELGLLQ